jgi:hypothetical protein
VVLITKETKMNFFYIMLGVIGYALIILAVARLAGGNGKNRGE